VADLEFGSAPTACLDAPAPETRMTCRIRCLPYEHTLWRQESPVSTGRKYLYTKHSLQKESSDRAARNGKNGECKWLTKWTSCSLSIYLVLSKVLRKYDTNI